MSPSLKFENKRDSDRPSDREYGVILPNAGTLIGVIDIFLCLVAMGPICVANIKNIFTKNEVDAGQNELGVYETVKLVVLKSSLGIILIELFAAFLLCAAVADDDRHKVVPWLIVNFVSIVVRIITVVKLIYQNITENTETIMLIVIHCIVLGILIYFWLIVLALFHYLPESPSFFIKVEKQRNFNGD